MKSSTILTRNMADYCGHNTSSIMYYWMMYYRLLCFKIVCGGELLSHFGGFSWTPATDYIWFKYDLDKSTTHPKFDPTGFKPMTSRSRAVHFMSLRHHCLNHSAIMDFWFTHVHCVINILSIKKKHMNDHYLRMTANYYVFCEGFFM